MAYFSQITDSRRFAVTDPDHPYHNHIVALYDPHPSRILVAPVGECGFVGEPVGTFSDQIEEVR